MSETMDYIGQGIYSISDVARLTGIDNRKIARWVRGYEYHNISGNGVMELVFRSDFMSVRGKVGLSFLDMVEIRFVDSFRKHDVSWRAIRIASSKAAELLNCDHPANRAPGSTAEVDLWTSRDVREIVKGHLNYVVADTKVWEQSAAYAIDTHPRVEAFVKNAGLGFAIPYLHNGQPHEYIPDFIIRLAGKPTVHLILETKGFDEMAEIKAQAAERWVKAVNADGRFGEWRYAMARKPEEVREMITRISKASQHPT